MPLKYLGHLNSVPKGPYIGVLFSLPNFLENEDFTPNVSDCSLEYYVTV